MKLMMNLIWWMHFVIRLHLLWETVLESFVCLRTLICIVMVLRLLCIFENILWVNYAWIIVE
jgi:hypothetical protein